MRGQLHVIAEDIGETPDAPSWIDVAPDGLELECAPLLGAYAGFDAYLRERGEE